MSAADPIHFGTDGWRAVIGADFTYDNLRRVADATGRVFASQREGGTVIIGYDTRTDAALYAAAAAEVLAAHGLNVVLSDAYCPTPCLCWSVAHDADAIGGVMLTASHNPASYLGFKVRMEDGGASPASFTDLIESELRAEPPSGRGAFAHADLVGPYLDAVLAFVDADAIRRAGLKVAVDPLYGAGRGYLAGLLRSVGVEVTEIHGNEDPSFGGLHPEPIPPHIDEVRALVRERGLDAAFITDGDADRIGAADRSGAFVDPHRIIALVARHLIEDRGMSGRIVKTLSTSVIVDRLGAALGAEVTTTPVGFKWIYEEMVKGGVLLGGEESGGIGVPAHVRERDGLLMSLLLAEMMAQRGCGLAELVADLELVTGHMEYGRNDLRLDPAVKDAFVATWPTLEPTEVAGLPVLRTSRADGVKLFFPNDAWMLFRASGTEPLIRVYAESASADEVAALLAAGRSMAGQG
jgi:phosphomannomutase